MNISTVPRSLAKTHQHDPRDLDRIAKRTRDREYVMTRSAPAEAGAGADLGGIDHRNLTPSVGPSRPDRIMLYSLGLSWDLPDWFNDLGAIPWKSELDAWRWAFRAHGSRTLTQTQMNVLWTVLTYAQAKDTDRGPVGMAWPSQETIAKELRVTPQTVGTALKAAEESGWLLRQRRPNRVSSLFFSMPNVLSPVIARRSPRTVPTENRTAVTTENQTVPDGEPGLCPDGEEPTEELTPTSESTSSNGLTTIASPARDNVAPTKEIDSVEKRVGVRMRPTGTYVELLEASAQRLIDDGRAFAHDRPSTR